MTIGEIIEYLEIAKKDKILVQVVLDNGESFNGRPCFLDEGDDDLGWDFKLENGIHYGVYLKDIVSLERKESAAA
jgi:hypothetical protein